MRWRSTVAAIAVSLPLLTHAPASANEADRSAFPPTVALPAGFQPEGVTVHGTTLYAGSLVDGDIYRASIVDGAGARFIDAPAGRTALGINTDRHHHLFVAGGPLGTAYVYDTRSGAALAEYQLAPADTSLVNDVVITPAGVFFTDSLNAVLYRLPVARNGALPEPGAVEVLPLTGPAADDLAAGQINLNGIVYDPANRALVVVNSFLGALYRIDPRTGASTSIDLGGEALPNGDGLVLQGRTLYVVQNLPNKVGVVRLQRDLSAGAVGAPLTDPRFQIPSTADSFGRSLYVVNARFDVAPPPFGGTPPVGPSITFDVNRVATPSGHGR